MGLVDGLEWRSRLWRQRLYLATSFRNGASLALAYGRRRPVARAVCWDGTVISHPPDRLGLTETLLEVWRDQVYTRGFYRPAPGDRILDGGANIGLFSLWVARQVRCDIVAFEPFAQNYELLRRNLASAGATWVIAKQAGLSGTSGRAHMTPATPRSLDHRLVLAAPNEASDAIPTCSLEQATDLFDGEVDLCKLDIEGSERDVFEGANEVTLRRVRRFAVEYHDNIRPGTCDLLRRRLEETHDVRISANAAGYGMLYARRRNVSA